MKNQRIKQIFLLSTTGLLPLSAVAVAVSCGESSSTTTPNGDQTQVDPSIAADQVSTARYDVADIVAPVVDEAGVKSDISTLVDKTSAEKTTIESGSDEVKKVALAVSEGLKKGLISVNLGGKAYTTVGAAISDGKLPSDFKIPSVGSLPAMTALVYALTKAYGIDPKKLNDVNTLELLDAINNQLSDKANTISMRITSYLTNWDGKGSDAMASWKEFFKAWAVISNPTGTKYYKYAALRNALIGSGETTRTATNSITAEEFGKIDAYLSAAKLLKSDGTTPIKASDGTTDLVGGTSLLAKVAAPSVTSSRMKKLTEAESIAYIRYGQSTAAKILRKAIGDIITNDKLEKKLGVTTADEFLAKNKVVFDLGPYQVFENIPNLLVYVLPEIINKIWKIDTKANKITVANFISEIVRMSGAGTGAVTGLGGIVANYENNVGEPKAHPEWAVGASWANFLHFVRIALDETPQAVYQYEALRAIFLRLGSTPEEGAKLIQDFNNKISEPYVLNGNTVTGGYGATKLNIAPRKY